MNPTATITQTHQRHEASITRYLRALPLDEREVEGGAQVAQVKAPQQAQTDEEKLKNVHKYLREEAIPNLCPKYQEEVQGWMAASEEGFFQRYDLKTADVEENLSAAHDLLFFVCNDLHNVALHRTKDPENEEDPDLILLRQLQWTKAADDVKEIVKSILNTEIEDVEAFIDTHEQNHEILKLFYSTMQLAKEIVNNSRVGFEDLRERLYSHVEKATDDLTVRMQAMDKVLHALNDEKKSSAVELHAVYDNLTATVGGLIGVFEDKLMQAKALATRIKTTEKKSDQVLSHIENLLNRV